MTWLWAVWICIAVIIGVLNSEANDGYLGAGYSSKGGNFFEILIFNSPFLVSCGIGGYLFNSSLPSLYSGDADYAIGAGAFATIYVIEICSMSMFEMRKVRNNFPTRYYVGSEERSLDMYKPVSARVTTIFIIAALKSIMFMIVLLPYAVLIVFVAIIIYAIIDH